MSVQETSEIRELTSDEVDQVEGGLVVIAIIAISDRYVGAGCSRKYPLRA